MFSITIKSSLLTVSQKNFPNRAVVTVVVWVALTEDVAVDVNELDADVENVLVSVDVGVDVSEAEVVMLFVADDVYVDVADVVPELVRVDVCVVEADVLLHPTNVPVKT